MHPLARAGGHPSGTAIAGSLVRSTREHRAGRPQALAQAPRPKPQSPLDLAPGGVYQAAQVTPSAGGLLHHPHQALTCTNQAARSISPPVVRRPPGGIAPPFPAELALSNRRRWNTAVQFAIRRRSWPTCCRSMQPSRDLLYAMNHSTIPRPGQMRPDQQERQLTRAVTSPGRAATSAILPPECPSQ